jgi:hypothetical protein
MSPSGRNRPRWFETRSDKIINRVLVAGRPSVRGWWGGSVFRNRAPAGPGVRTQFEMGQGFRAPCLNQACGFLEHETHFLLHPRHLPQVLPTTCFNQRGVVAPGRRAAQRAEAVISTCRKLKGFVKKDLRESRGLHVVVPTGHGTRLAIIEHTTFETSWGGGCSPASMRKLWLLLSRSLPIHNLVLAALC